MKSGEFIGIGAAILGIWALARTFGDGQDSDGGYSPAWGSESITGISGGEGTGVLSDEPVNQGLSESPGESVGAEQVINQTQAPNGDPTYQLGTPQNPLYTEITGGLIGWTGAGGWYERRNISEVLGWSEQEYIEQREYMKTIGASERTAAQSYAGGYTDTMQAANYVTARYKLIKSLGGSIEGGILRPPENWTGSVTEFSNEVKSLLNEQGVIAK